MAQKNLLGEDTGYIYTGNKCPMCSGAAKIRRVSTFAYLCSRCSGLFVIKKESDFKKIQFAQKKKAREKRTNSGGE